MRRSAVSVLATLAALAAVGGGRGDSVVVLGGRKTGCDDAGADADACREPQPTFRPYSQQELEALLEQRLAQFANVNAAAKRPPPTNKLADLYTDAEDAVINVLESGDDGGGGGGDRDQEESKSSQWHQAQSRPRPPAATDDRDETGWVTLEPIPWAHSQIQKWEPHAKPQIPSWESGGFGGGHWPHQQGHERPWQGPPKPPAGANHYQYGYDKPSSASYHWGGRPSPDIITDDRPDRFPTRPWPDQQSYSSASPPPQVSRPRPGEGDGQWVLLSSTKGYSAPPPHRHGYQRALRADAAAKTPTASLSGHRTVRLTVLPPADDSSITTKLSHNGLLEVDSSGQTVEEAQREHAAKMLKLPDRNRDDVRENEVKPPPQKSLASARRSGNSVQVYGSTSASAAADRTAVLAALGAGALPATLAVLVPMALGRRRRRRATGAGWPT